MKLGDTVLAYINTHARDPTFYLQHQKNKSSKTTV